MNSSSRVRTAALGTVCVVIVGLVAATAWLLKPTWEAYREQVAFEQAVRNARLQDEASIAELSKLARQSGLPSFAAERVEKERAVLIPFYLRAYWYCVIRLPPTGESDAGTPNKLASAPIQIYRLEIPLENYQPQTEDARNLVARTGHVNIRNTPSGPVEEPALPLVGEEARRIAFITDFFHVISGQSDGNLGIRYELIHADPVP